MNWGLIVLAANTLLLIGGWVLFQQAKSELNAMMAELRSIQAAVEDLPRQMKDESEKGWIENEKREAQLRTALDEIERRISDTGRNGNDVFESKDEDIQQKIFTLADGGIPAAVIARQIGLSEGEVEVVIGMREKELQVNKEGD
ncbi:MAG: hypothetical protein M1330_00240 [Armatimonadetes bacterium]|nr:hypothetical protein [Armatimonadota bacterium]